MSGQQLNRINWTIFFVSQQWYLEQVLGSDELNIISIMISLMTMQLSFFMYCKYATTKVNVKLALWILSTIIVTVRLMIKIHYESKNNGYSFLNQTVGNQIETCWSPVFYDILCLVSMVGQGYQILHYRELKSKFYT